MNDNQNTPVTESSKSASDLRDYVKHLRTIHFTLLTACIVLLATSLTRVKSDPERALEQLDEILEVCNDTKWSPRWLEDEVGSQPNNPEIFGILDSLDVREIDDPPARFKFEGPLWTLHPAPVLLRSRDEDEDRSAYFPGIPEKRPLIIDQPQTIAEFKQMWDVLLAPIAVHIPNEFSDSAFVYEIGRDLGAVDGVEVVKVRRSDNQETPRTKLTLDTPYETEFTRVGSELNTLKDTTDYVMAGAIYSREETLRIIVPVTTRVHEFDAHEMFRTAYHTKWESGPFTHVFRELDRISSEYQDMRFDRARGLVELARRRAEEKTKFLGIEVPTAELLRWGLTVVVIIQLYLWLHLLALRLHLPGGDRVTEVPWIGIYSNRWSKAVTIASAILGPALITVILGIKGLAESPNGTTFVVAAATISGSILLCWFSYREFIKVWKLLDENGSGVDELPSVIAADRTASQHKTETSDEDA